MTNVSHDTTQIRLIRLIQNLFYLYLNFDKHDKGTDVLEQKSYHQSWSGMRNGALR